MVSETLRRRSLGAPAARSVLLTILGEYVLSRPEGIWQETLVAALAAMGYGEQAARQALARSVRENWLHSERHGRRARLYLTEETAQLLREGAQRIYEFGADHEWDGRWLVVILRVPESRREVRHQLRTKLAWAGLGTLGGGIWITPHSDREAEVVDAMRKETVADVLSLHCRIGALGDPQLVAAAAWDLQAVTTAYEEFMAAFTSVRDTTPEAGFATQTALVHSWRRFPFLDPDLPLELLPSHWPRRSAHQLFLDRHARWEPLARVAIEAWEDAVPHQVGSSKR